MKTRERVYHAVCQLTEERGYPPTVREIGWRTGLRSTSTVHRHLMELVYEGALKQAPVKARGWRPLVDPSGREKCNVPGCSIWSRKLDDDGRCGFNHDYFDIHGRTGPTVRVYG